MLWDMYPTLIMEYGSPPGIYGDACAETGRYYSLVNYLASIGISTPNVPDITKSLNNFRTDAGYIRHPLVPLAWRETDFSEDQWVPLFIASKESGVKVAGSNTSMSDEMNFRLSDAGWKTGNGDLIHPGTLGTLLRANGKANFVADLPMLVGLIITRYIPIRWSDSKKWFESSGDNSGDYLNLIHQVMYAETTKTGTLTTKLIKYLFRFCDLQGKIGSYYKNESPWIQDMYRPALEKLIE